MNEKELKELQAKIETEQKSQHDAVEALKKASETQKTELIGKIEEAEKKLAKLEGEKTELSKQFDAMALEMKDQKLGGKEEDPYADMKAFITDKSKVGELKQKGASKSFELKVGSTMTSSTNLSSGTYADRVVVPFREPGVGKAPSRQPVLLDLISRGNINSDMDTWVERSARTISAASVAEGGAYIQSDATYINRSQPVERLGHFFKVQTRCLEDWDQLLSEINVEGFTGLERELERQVYVGTGSTPELQGITDTGFAAAFSSTSLSGVKTPNIFDAIRASIMQIREYEYQPNPNFACFINPADGAAMDMPKNDLGTYLLPPFMSANGTIVKGVPVIESTLVTAGDLLVGDFSKVLLLMKRGIEIRIYDQNENDALYDRKTITISCRAVNRIRQTDLNAFVYDQIADIISAIS